MDRGGYRLATDTDVDFHLPAAPRPRKKLLPEDVERLVARFERAGTTAALAELEQDLADVLELTAIVCVTYDWCERTAWSPRGPIAPRVAEFVCEAVGTGRRVVCPNAIVEPIGRAPAHAALVIKGSPERLFRPYLLRTFARVAERLAARRAG